MPHMITHTHTHTHTVLFYAHLHQTVRFGLQVFSWMPESSRKRTLNTLHFESLTRAGQEVALSVRNVYKHEGHDSPLKPTAV